MMDKGLPLFKKFIFIYLDGWGFDVSFFFELQVPFFGSMGIPLIPAGPKNHPFHPGKNC